MPKKTFVMIQANVDMAFKLDNDQSSIRSSFPPSFQSPTFDKDGSFHVNEAVGAASISPGGRDVVLASREGLHIIDLDNPYSPPRYLAHHTSWEVADVQWSPFAARDYWIVSTSNQKALVWNLELSASGIPIEHVLHAHTRAITDINFSAHEPDFLATCAVDSFIHCWDLRQPWSPAISFAEWIAGATQVKWNRQDPNVLASSHDKALYIWDRRNSARPLRLIDAHKTKIYGIDWSRLDATQLLTCSSDRTIKLWDYTCADNVAKKIVRTSYPIWRARHTPFGTGILAMPQRGNNSLYLYDQEAAQATEADTPMEPVYSFDGHGDQVKEFLWRVRHGVEEGKDDRAFQLVSWGSDKNLMLHRMDDTLLKMVGFERGKPVDKRFNFTRKGAIYRTFHDNKEMLPTEMRSPVLPVQGLISMYRDGTKYDSRPTSKASPLLHPNQPGMRIRSGEKRSPNTIAWMKGVRIMNTKEDNGSMRESVSHLTLSSAPPWDTREGLGDEIANAGDKYKKVAFEKVDVPSRTVSLSLNGPWGPDNSLVHLRTAMNFPKEYPEDGAPQFVIEKTSSISDAAFTKLKFELKTLCETYSSIGRGCLEAVLCYLLGEQTLQGSIGWIIESKALDTSLDLRVDESSSDEEDDVIGVPFGSLDVDVNRPDVINALANANVPLPKGCGALWSQDGRLVCFFPAKEEAKSAVELLDATLIDLESETPDMFEGFGRLHVRPLESSRRRLRSISFGSDASSSASSDFSSSSISSDADSNGNPSLSASVRGGAASNRMKNLRSLERSVDHSNRSSSRPMLKNEAIKPKTVVSIQSLDSIIPSSRAMAEEYIVFGNGSVVCSHNAGVAAKYGFDEIADVWRLVELVLCNDVPLTVMPQAHRAEEILILARSQLVHIKRKDSGIDLAFDRPADVVNAKLRSHVKWGHHPFAGAWLIDVLFEHFENVADVQMLAMLSCIFSEPAGTEGASISLRNLPDRDLPMALKAPAFSLDYFPSTEVAWSHYEPEDAANLQKFADLPTGSFGSFTSSNGPWSSDATQYDDPTQHSDDQSPPFLTRQNSRGSNVNVSSSLSSSPEQEMKRSNSINAFATSYKSLIFGLSSSPPSQRTQAPPQLSSSAPNSGPLLNTSGVSWGRNTIYEDTASVRHLENYSNTFYEDDFAADEDYPHEAEEVVTVLKNQNMFDDEACFSAPLLKPEETSKYCAYREAYASLLDVWGLPLQRCEILKFNSLVQYFPGPMSKSEAESQIEIGKPKMADAIVPTLVETEKHQGLSPAVYCTGCGDVLLLHAAEYEAVPHCPNCSQKQSRLTCSICYESIRGLYKPCLNCGHVVHTECQDEWMTDAGVEEYGECETGCGCCCSEMWKVDAGELLGSSGDSDSMQGEVGTTETETETETMTTVWDWPKAGWDDVTGVMRGGVIGDRTGFEPDVD